MYGIKHNRVFAEPFCFACELLALAAILQLFQSYRNTALTWCIFSYMYFQYYCQHIFQYFLILFGQLYHLRKPHIFTRLRKRYACCMPKDLYSNFFSISHRNFSIHNVKVWLTFYGFSKKAFHFSCITLQFNS